MSNTAGVDPSRDQASRARRRRLWWYVLLLVQFAAVAWPPLYNKVEPAWAGIPFFYWYQLVWIVIGAVLTAIVYFATESTRQKADAGQPPPVA
jgi:hypothetical protein